MPMNHNRLAAGLAVLILIGLMLALSYNSVMQLRRIDRDLSNISEQHHRKASLMGEIEIQVHLRIEMLNTMVFLADPFERDELYLQLAEVRHGMELTLKKLSGLLASPDERSRHAELSTLVNDLANLQDAIASQLRAGQDAYVRMVLVERIQPMQAVVQSRLRSLRGLEDRSLAQALIDARGRYRDSLRWSLGLGLLGLAAGVAVGLWLFGRIKSQARRIGEDEEALRLTRAERTMQDTQDELTGLANRKHFMDKLADRLARGGEARLLYLDINQFKRLNQSEGFDAGSAALREIGHRLYANIGDEDCVARVGGDDFAVLLAPGADARATAQLTGRLRAAVLAAWHFEGREIPLDARFGSAASPTNGANPQALLAAAMASANG
jgi:diguanylate cyclase (GGDEF)-like protein